MRSVCLTDTHIMTCKHVFNCASCWCLLSRIYIQLRIMLVLARSQVDGELVSAQNVLSALVGSDHVGSIVELKIKDMNESVSIVRLRRADARQIAAKRRLFSFFQKMVSDSAYGSSEVSAEVSKCLHIYSTLQVPSYRLHLEQMSSYIFQLVCILICTPPGIYTTPYRPPRKYSQKKCKSSLLGRNKYNLC